jgi:hypothetical protein
LRRQGLPPLPPPGGAAGRSKSILLATFLESINHPTRFVAVGSEPDYYSHVYLETQIGGRWYTMETTEPVPAGWEPTHTVSRMVVHN